MSIPLALSAPGITEWFIILIIVLVLFGAKRLPELARGLGQSLNEFRKAKDEFEKEIHKTSQEISTKPAPKIEDASQDAVPAKMVEVPKETEPHRPA